MPGNSFGNLFKVTTWGESHGEAVGAVLDGCPAGLKLSEKDIQNELDRRKPGQNKLTTERKEDDKIKILSGIFEGKTTGTPLSFLVANTGHKSQDYSGLANVYRPSHADFTYEAKYSLRDYRGGGRASARETIGRVIAGAVAKKILGKTEVIAYVKQVYNIEAKIDPSKVKPADVEKSPVRCPDQKVANKMIQLIEQTKRAGDSVGGIIECVIRNVPVGLGSPVFDKLDARLAQAMLSIPAVKGFEVGSGFVSARMTGSEHNDPIIKKNNKVMTLTNNAGGIVGGISNGMDIVFRVAFKPAASISKKQQTITKSGKTTSIQISGRHDACVLPRAVPIVEAMAAIVLADEYLINKAVK